MSEVFNVNPAAGTNTAQYSERDALDAVITSKDTLELSAARERTTAAIPPPATRTSQAWLVGSRLSTWFWPLSIIASAIAVNVVVLVDSQSVVRPLLVLWFMLICPGMAFVRLLRLKSMAVELSLATALSVALATILAGSLLYSGLWSPTAGLITLGCIAVLGAVAQIALAYLRASESDNRR